jgi:hypothetical protein
VVKIVVILGLSLYPRASWDLDTSIKDWEKQHENVGLDRAALQFSPGDLAIRSGRIQRDASF